MNRIVVSEKNFHENILTTILIYGILCTGFRYGICSKRGGAERVSKLS